MCVIIAHFPEIKEGKEQEFLDWFAWSNEEFSKLKGFIRRYLLKPSGGGIYTVIIEYESFEAFKALSESPLHVVSAQRVLPLLNGVPAPVIYEKIME